MKSWRERHVHLAAAMAALAPLFGVTPATANADPSDYLQQVQKELPYIYDEYGRQAILTEGYRICGYVGAGHGPHGRDRSCRDGSADVAVHSAIELETIADVYLDC